MKSKFLFLVIVTFLFIPSFASASIEITEIMYDREGTDTKREWIEVFNKGEDSIDILSFYFREDETNHRLSEYRGGIALPPGDYAIIASNPEEIISEFDSEVIVFDSAFSLSNSGELLQIVDADDIVLDEVFYDVEIGAGGDGRSLQKIDGYWQAENPTAGFGNTQSDFSEEKAVPDDSVDDTDTSSGTNNTIQEIIVDKNPFYIEFALPDYISVGDPVVFAATAKGSSGREYKYAKFFWSFGDGTSGKGSEIAHTYRNTGKYTVYLRAEYNEYTDNKKIKINVYDSPIIIRKANRIEGSFEFYNTSSSEHDLGGWSILSGERFYKIPQYTFISPKSSIKIDSSAIGWQILHDFKVMNPFGNFAREEIQEQEQTTINKNKTVTNSIITKTVKADTSDNISFSEDDEIESEKLEANIGNTKTPSGTMLWLLLLFAVMGIGAFGLYFLQKKDAHLDDVDIMEE